jgi:transposase
MVITFPVSDRKHETLILLIKQYTKKESLYYSDENIAYTLLELIGKHRSISNNRDEYVRDDTHINGIEGFWSYYAKTWLYRYRGINKGYFHICLKEVEFGFNHKNDNLFDLISKLLIQLVEVGIT